MGYSGQIIAIGPFSKGVLPALEYPDEMYASVPEGATVITNVFITDSSTASESLAAAFGTNPRELGQHHLQPSRVDLRELAWHFAEDIPKFELLRDHGFQFYFLPNG
jgi:hypothetical protein